MRVFYDTEFLEDGKTIMPISIGMVAEDGREFYAVFEEILDCGEPHQRICTHGWLMENVVPHLPLRTTQQYPEGYRLVGNSNTANFWLDTDSLEVMPRTMVRKHVKAFLDAIPNVELWAWYGAYDHVMLAQLFGAMADRPASMPMWTNDVRQLQLQCGVSDGTLEAEVRRVGDAHHALFDAMWTRSAHAYLVDSQA